MYLTPLNISVSVHLFDRNFPKSLIIEITIKIFKIFENRVKVITFVVIAIICKSADNRKLRSKKDL